MPKLKITPANSKDPVTGYIKILMDGSKITEVLDNKEAEMEIAEGTHKLKVTSGWFSSNEVDFSIANNETKTYNLSKVKYNQYILWTPLLLILLNPIVKRSYSVDLFIPAMAILLVLAIHKFFIMKNKFFFIEETR